MKKIKWIMLLVACLYIAVFMLSHYDNKEYSLSNVEAYIQTISGKANVPGLSAVVINGDDEEYYNYGYANKKEKQQTSSDTQYELASTTKAFTALCVLLLEQEGRIHREDAIEKYIPWFQPTYQGQKAEITIENLLCHTSGIPSWTISTIPEGSDHALLETTIRNIADVSLNHKPGTAYEYATINFDVLAYIIETITGERFEDYATKNVLLPLGMKNSYFRTNDTKQSNNAQGHKYQYLGAMAVDSPTYYGNMAAGYLVSSANDLSLWLKAQMGTLDISQELKDAIAISHTYAITEDLNYWAGWILGDGFIAHAGSNPNYSTQVIIDTENPKAIFTLANVNGSTASRVADDIFRMMRGETIKIGMHLDYMQLLDFIAGLVCLVVCFVGAIIIERRKNNKKFVIIKTIVGMVVAIGILLFPYLIKDTYRVMLVWYSPLIIVAGVMVVACIGLYVGIGIRNKLK